MERRGLNPPLVSPPPQQIPWALLAPLAGAGAGEEQRPELQGVLKTKSPHSYTQDSEAQREAVNCPKVPSNRGGKRGLVSSSM